MDWSYLYKNFVPGGNLAIEGGRYVSRLLGWDAVMGARQKDNSQGSTTAQIDYENYLEQGYRRQYEDWMRNVGRYGRTIRYPELSFPGYMYRADTSITRNMFDYDTASANYYGNLPYRVAGLYGITGKFSRYL